MNDEVKTKIALARRGPALSRQASYTLMKFNWRCPFCSHAAVIHDGQNGTFSAFRHEFAHGNKHGYQAVRGHVIVCPNDDCKEYVIEISLHDHKQNPGKTEWVDVNAKRRWRLIPDSE